MIVILSVRVIFRDSDDLQVIEHFEERLQRKITPQQICIVGKIICFHFGRFFCHCLIETDRFLSQVIES
jgi:hypothetical protein